MFNNIIRGDKLKIKDIPVFERPRERLEKFGEEALSNEELLSIILKTGTKDKSVKDLSLDILKKIDDISNLKTISINNLTSIKGIGKAKAVELIASIELGRRIFLTSNGEIKPTLKSSLDVFLYTKELFFDKKQEYFYCLYFDSKQRLIDKKLLFIGTINRSIVHPREIFKYAYILSACSIICLHNHPSGDVNPSVEDIKLTQALVEIGKIQGINVVDHIIISNNNYYSFIEHNKIRR